MLHPVGLSQKALPFGKVVGGILLHHWLWLVTTATAGSLASSRLRGVAQMREAPQTRPSMKLLLEHKKWWHQCWAVRKLWTVYTMHNECVQYICMSEASYQDITNYNSLCSSVSVQQINIPGTSWIPSTHSSHFQLSSYYSPFITYKSSCYIYLLRSSRMFIPHAAFHPNKKNTSLVMKNKDLGTARPICHLHAW